MGSFFVNDANNGHLILIVVNKYRIDSKTYFGDTGIPYE